MSRECGDCNLCCKLPMIKEENFYKKEYTWCKNCDVGGTGCTIYNDRPKTCKTFICGWLEGSVPLEWKPNKVGFIVTVEPHGPEHKVMTLYADTHKVHNIANHLKKIEYTQDGEEWSYVIRYNTNENDLAVFDRQRFGDVLMFCKRGEL